MLSIYKLAVVVILLTTIARRSVVEALLPSGSHVAFRTLRTYLGTVHPALYLLIPTLLALDLMGFDALAGGIFEALMTTVITENGYPQPVPNSTAHIQPTM